MKIIGKNTYFIKINEKNLNNLRTVEKTFMTPRCNFYKNLQPNGQRFRQINNQTIEQVNRFRYLGCIEVE